MCSGFIVGGGRVDLTRSVYIVFLTLFITISSLANVFIQANSSIYPKVLRLNDLFLEIDRNSNHIDDYLENISSGRVEVIVLLSTPPMKKHLDLARSVGAEIIAGPWYKALRGFAVSIDASMIHLLYEKLLYTDLNNDGYSDLYFLQMSRIYKADMYWAARQVYVRPLVWRQLGISGENVTVAVLDSGVDVDAPGIDSAKIIVGYDATGRGLDPYSDELGHGTAVTSAIIGELDGGTALNYSIAVRIPGDSLILASIYIPGSGTVKLKAFLSPYSDEPLYVNYYAKLHVFRANQDYPENMLWAWNNNDYTYLGFTWFQNFSGYDLLGWTGEIILDVIPGTYFFNITGIDSVWSDDGRAHLLIIMEYVPSQTGNDSYPVYTGIAPNSSIASIKITDNGTTTTAIIANAMEWVLNNTDTYNIDVVSLSYTTDTPDPAIGNASYNLYRNGITIVASAGNDGVNSSGVGYPSAYPWVLSVGAVNRLNQVANFSSMGAVYTYNGTTYIKPDVVAPGGGFDSFLALSESNNNTPSREPMYINDTQPDYYEEPYDLGMYAGTSFSAPVVAGIAALVYSALRHNGTYDILYNSDPELLSRLVMNIIKISTYETYPLAREYPSNQASYSPTYDYGEKDVHEGYGAVDAYDAVWTAILVSHILLGDRALDYAPYNNMQYLWTFISSIREGVVYGGSINYPFGSSLLSAPVHFERYQLVLPNNDTIHSRYIMRYIISNWSDIDNTQLDFIIYVMGYPDPLRDAYLRINTSTLVYNTISNWYEGVAPYEPPSIEEDYDLIYFLTIKRAMENLSGVDELRLLFGPSLYIVYKPGSEFGEWGSYVYIRTLNPLDPRIYGHKVIWLFWWRNFTDPNDTYFLGFYANDTPSVGYTIVHKEGKDIITPISNATTGDTYICLETDLKTPTGEPLYYIPQGIITVWALVVDQSVDTTNYTTLVNTLTPDKVIGGPVGGYINLYEPIYQFSVSPSYIRDGDPFTLYVRLLDPDTLQPLDNERVYFYVWIPPDPSTITYLGSATTNATGYASITLVSSYGGEYSFYVEFNGSIRTDLVDPITGGPKYFKASISQDYNVSIYWRTGINVSVSPSNPYTVETTTIAAKLYRVADSQTIADQELTVKVYKYNGLTWIPIDTYTCYTNSTGMCTVSLNHIQYGYGQYKVEVVFNGNDTVLLDGSTSEQTYSVQITPTYIRNLSYNATNRKVYDLIEFELDLVYNIGSGDQPIGGATVYLYVNDTGTYVLRNQTTTDQFGHAVLGYRPTRNGTYSFRIEYQGNDTYASVDTIVNIQVRSRYTAFTNVIYPSSSSINQTMTVEFILIDNENIDGSVNGTGLPSKTVVLQRLDGGSWVDVASTTTNSTGGGVISWYETSSGNYTYRLYFSGTDYVYYPTYYEFNVSVYTLTTGITVIVNTTTPYVGEPVNITARLVQDGSGVDGELLLLEYYNGSQWVLVDTEITSNGGYATFIISHSYAGTYTYRIRYEGSNVYTPSKSSNIDINVQPLDVILNVSTTVGYVDEESIITVELVLKNGTPLASKPVNLYIWNGTAWELVGTNYTNSTGYTVFTVILDNATNYWFKLEFNDPGAAIGQRIYADNYTLVNITPLKRPSDMVLTVSNTTPMAGDYIVFMVKLSDLRSGSDIVSGNVTLYVNGSYVATAKTNSTGYALFNITADTPGVYNYTIVFNGFVDDYLKYVTVSDSVIVNVSKIKTVLIVSIITSPKPVIGEPVLVTGWLKLYNGTELANEQVELTVYNGSLPIYSSTNTTNSTGYFEFEFTLSSPGTYDVVVRYTGTTLLSSTLYTSGLTIKYGVVIEIIRADAVYYGGMVNVTLLIRAYTIPGNTPLANTTLDIYLSHSPATYIGNVTTNSTGYALYTYQDSPYYIGATYTVAYNGSATTWDNKTSTYINYPISSIPQPLPEQWYLPLYLLSTIIAIVLIYSIRRRYRLS